MATMREAFEKWFSDDGAYPNAVKRSNGGEYLLSQAATAWNVWQAAYSSRDEQVRILREAAQGVIDAWNGRDLAGAVGKLVAALEATKPEEQETRNQIAKRLIGEMNREHELEKRNRILREALDEIQRMSGVRGRWLDDDGCAVETEDNDGTDPENKPDGAGEWSAYELDEQNAALECITERALAALEATKEGA